MSFRRETIHVSLGSTANLVSAHLLNLQGLAATSGYCPADITHAVQDDFYVPRCLFVDEGEALQFHDPAMDPTTAPTKVDDPYLQAANVLAYSQYSRYRAPKTHVHKHSQYATSSNGRHVEWNDDDEDEDNGEDDDEEQEEERRKRQEREQYQWQTERFPPLQKLLDDHWATPALPAADDATVLGVEGSGAPPVAIQRTEAPLDYLSFFAPPFPTNYQCALPFSSKSNMVETWDSYTTASVKLASKWNENVLFEKLRKVLEKSDGVQGVTLATQGHGVFAGLNHCLVARAARRMSDCWTYRLARDRSNIHISRKV